MSESQTATPASQERLGNVLYKIRKAHRLKQKDVADRMEMHADTLRRYEKGMQIPRPADLQKLYQAIGVTEDEARELRQMYLAADINEPEIKTRQGEGAQHVFQSLFPILYASIAPVNGAYDRQSEKCAALADAYAGLQRKEPTITGLTNKRILDIGCGFGSTTLAISAYNPREIFAVDRTEGMIELFEHVLCKETDLYVWLESKGADELLGESYYRTVMYLRWMRATFQGSLFKTHGTLETRVCDSLDIRAIDFPQFDVVIGNNFLHWPVNERRRVITEQEPELKGDQVTARACRDALLPLASVLKPGGIAVFLEPKGFITFDRDEEDEKFDRELEERTYTKHPVYMRFHEEVREILRQEYGMDHGIPRSTDLFRTSQLAAIVEQGGFKLKKIHHVDVTHAGDPLTFAFATAPLVLGNVRLNFHAKFGIAKRVQRKLAADLKEGAAHTPIREQQFFLILERL